MYEIIINKGLSGELFAIITIEHINDKSLINKFESIIKKYITEQQDFILYYNDDLIYNKCIMTNIIDILLQTNTITLTIFIQEVDDVMFNYYIYRYIRNLNVIVCNYTSYDINLNLILKYIYLYCDIDLYRLIPDKMNDYNFVMNAVINNGNALKYASDELKDNYNIVLEAIKSSCFAIEFASNRLKNYKNIILEAVKKSGCLLYYASEKLKNNKKIVLEAVSNNGYSLSYASNRLQNDKKVVIKALESSNISFAYSSYKIRSNKNIALLAVKKYGSSMIEYLSNELKNDKDILLMVNKADNYIKN